MNNPKRIGSFFFQCLMPPSILGTAEVIE